eukprot:CAMPEP_0183369788 /NCGR_PEP_ID=MMETSP0164_2-20130417/100602_1 /TAXON_ID=221442 /ORGANISM="Coccolithus pelagicus ssp braarudi, Strain PLY182g" /LENGTH=187 /DNA_ID=CAMNT_0025546095 /DNA_START=20 /DNA_END=579 /DNA_ORIENTATION=-
MPQPPPPTLVASQLPASGLLPPGAPPIPGDSDQGQQPAGPSPMPTGASMSPMRHLPPQQQRAMMAAMAAQQQQMQMHIAAFGQAKVPRPPARLGVAGVAELHMNPRLTARMSGAELQIIIRHQQMAVPLNDPVVDDFYHHFWQLKGGTSTAKQLAMRHSKAAVSTERRAPMEVHGSLGVAIISVRTP